MTEIRWHGRGGQGAFTAAKLLGAAVSLFEGRHSMAFPSFGPERRGAPVLAFTKISDEVIRDRTEIKRCDVIVLLDDTLYTPSYLQDLKEGGLLLINSTADAKSSETPVSISSTPAEAVKGRVIHLDALSVALPILGRPIANTAMLGALAGITGLVSRETLFSASQGFFSGKLLEKNRQVLEEAYRLGKEAAQ